MEADPREQIVKELNALAERVKNSPLGKTGEQVRINLDVDLVGQDAINYLVSKIFMRELTPEELINLMFRVGLNHTIELIRYAAVTEYGIKL